MCARAPVQPLLSLCLSLSGRPYNPAYIGNHSSVEPTLSPCLHPLPARRSAPPPVSFIFFLVEIFAVHIFICCVGDIEQSVEFLWIGDCDWTNSIFSFVFPFFFFVELLVRCLWLVSLFQQLIEVNSASVQDWTWNQSGAHADSNVIIDDSRLDVLDLIRFQEEEETTTIFSIWLEAIHYSETASCESLSFSCPPSVWRRWQWPLCPFHSTTFIKVSYFFLFFWALTSSSIYICLMNLFPSSYWYLWHVSATVSYSAAPFLLYLASSSSYSSGCKVSIISRALRWIPFL